REPVDLSVRQGDEIVQIERVSSNRPMKRGVQSVATRAPLHVSVVGKVFLAEEGSAAAGAYAQRIARLTDFTFDDPASLDRELAQVRLQGFAIDRGEAEKGV